MNRLFSHHSNKQKLSHAYLLAGPKGSGKVKQAVEFISNIGELGDKEKVINKKEPDVSWVESVANKEGKKKDISIEQVKEVVKDLYYDPTKAKKRFLVINETERLTNSAANCLLKVLEEPPKNVVILLLAHKEQQVLPTLRSRCQTIRMTWGQEQLQAIQQTETFQKDKEVFREALKSGVLNGLELAESYSKDREELKRAINHWIIYLRGFLKEQMANGAQKSIVKKIFSLLDSLMETQKQLTTSNINAKIVIENYFIQIA